MECLTAGFARADITPAAGVTVSLYGQFDSRITACVHDPLLCAALVLERQETRSIWVSCDLNFISTQLTREVEAKLQACLPNFSGEQLILTATHTHNAPFFDRDGYLSLTGESAMHDEPGTLPAAEYRSFVAAQVTRAVVAAWKQRQACRVELAVAQVITGVNRRVVYRDGTAKMYGKLSSPDFARMEGRDGGPSLLLYVYGEADNALLGIVADIPCPAQCDGASNYITADYWHVVRQQLAQVMGQQVCVLGMCRAAGDLAPRAMIDRIPGYNSKRNGAADCLRMGQWIADTIISHQRKTISVYDSQTPLQQAGCTCQYALWPVSQEEYRQAKEYAKTFPVCDPEKPGFDRYEFANTWVRIQRVEKQPQSISLLLRAVRLGDITLLTLPGEIYLEYADRIRAACPQTILMEVQLACSHIGYLATDAAVAHGHYSALLFNGLLAPEQGEQLIADAISLVRSLN